MNTNFFSKLPVNIDLLKVEEKDLIKLNGEITESQIFDNSNNFHSKGLFSVSIFGNVGSEYRNRTFGYIDLKIDIIHPIIYYAIINLKSYYKQIMDGSVTAEWNEELGEFIKSNSDKAETGFNFFFKHITKLKFEKNSSEKRSFLIDLFYKSIKENKYSLRYFLVIPAGIRDYIIDDNNKPQEDEINTYYRKLIYQSSIIDLNIVKKNIETYDSVRNSLQKTSLEIFDYIKSLLEGKHKLILGKWLTRRIFNSTRNVLSNPIEKANNINDKNRLGYNETYVGLHQFLRSLMPKTIYEIRNNYIKDIFIENNNFAYLTNVETLKKEQVLNSHIQKDYDLWTTTDGIEKIVASFGNLNFRHKEVTLNKGKHYLGLLYNDGKYFKFFSDIDDLPSTLSKDNVKPITLSEILYISVYRLSGIYPGLITRYPITGYGSIYPTKLKLKTTNVYQVLEELDNEWKPSGEIAYSFPIRDKDFFNTISANISHYGALGADVDGDALSLIAVLSDEAVSEINSYLTKREYYISPENKFYFSVDTDILDAVLNYMN